MLTFGMGTTGALAVFTQPYVLRAYWNEGSSQLRVVTLDLFAREVTTVLNVSDCSTGRTECDERGARERVGGWVGDNDLISFVSRSRQEALCLLCRQHDR